MSRSAEVMPSRDVERPTPARRPTRGGQGSPRGRRLPLSRIAGIQVRVDAWWFIVAALVFFVSILVHELALCAVAGDLDVTTGEPEPHRGDPTAALRRGPGCAADEDARGADDSLRVVPVDTIDDALRALTGPTR